MTNPDFRALCAELVDKLHKHTSRWEGHEIDLVTRARALLDQPVAEGPTIPSHYRGHEIAVYRDGFHAGYKEALAIAADRARRPTPQPLLDNYIDPGHTDRDRELLEIFYVACQSEGGTADEIHLRGIRAVMAQPPVAAGEVAELLEWLGDPIIVGASLATSASASRWLARATELLEHQYPQPVAVSERLPEPSVKVLAHYFNALGKGRTICAIWVPAKSRSDEGDLDADDFLEYDEENDKYHWPEGWYEAIENWEELGWAKVYEGEIAYWQPLPQWPANALPTPEAKP